MTAERHAFLAAYDYGTGGIWMKIVARTREEIAERYPQLTIFAEGERPEWMSEEEEASYTERFRFDFDSHEGTWLSRLNYEHWVEVEHVYGTGDPRDGYSWSRRYLDPSGCWREQPGEFFLAICACGWSSPMRQRKEQAIQDGRKHHEDSVPN
jgi:hypothetical protein